MRLTSEQEHKLIAALQRGLPLVSRPYAAIAAETGMSEAEVLLQIEHWRSRDIVKRFGVVVRHHELGYRANAMVVWDVPDQQVTALGRCMAQFEFVTLCYRRARHLPEWPYNLYCMVHGHDRESVLNKISFMIESCHLQELSHQVLFSLRRFKQRGAVYRSTGKQCLKHAAGNR